MIIRFLNFLIYANVYVAFPVTLIASTTYLLHASAPVDYSLLLLIYFSTLFLYCFHRAYPFQKLEHPALSNRYTWLENNRTLFLGIMLVALACAIGFGMMMSKVIWFWLIPLGLIAALYTIPVIRISGCKKRLRDIAYIKIFLIAITVTWVTVYLPIVNVGADFLIMNEELALLCGERFFFILCITIPFDIRDLHIDKKMGLKTIPTFLGVKKALLLSLVFLALFVVILTYHFISAELLSTTTFIAMMVSTAATALIIAKSTPKRSEYYFSFLVEGTMVIQFLLVLLVN